MSGACLDSKLLHNAETWINLTKGDVKKLEVIQMNFYKRLIGLPGGTQNTAVMKELGIMPMEYKIEIKMLIEYQTILQMSEYRLPKKVGVCAKEMGTKNILDKAKEIKEKHSLEYDDESVTRMTKYQWKSKVKNKVNITVQKSLQQECHKMKKLGHFIFP